MRRLPVIAAILTVSVLAYSCPAAANPADNDALSKLGFDLDPLNEAGLYGPEDGLRSLSYEFCVPNDWAAIATVQGIDPSLMIDSQSPGRIGCDESEVLAIGDTHQPNYRHVLMNLANLDMIDRIEQFWGE